MNCWLSAPRKFSCGKTVNNRPSNITGKSFFRYFQILFVNQAKVSPLDFFKFHKNASKLFVDQLWGKKSQQNHRNLFFQNSRFFTHQIQVWIAKESTHRLASFPNNLLCTFLIKVHVEIFSRAHYTLHFALLSISRCAGGGKFSTGLFKRGCLFWVWCAPFVFNSHSKSTMKNCQKNIFKASMDGPLHRKNFKRNKKRNSKNTWKKKRIKKH